ncbi:MAG TPA: hypothetical protein VIP48_04085 [Streptosporangiaceae bacterium]
MCARRASRTAAGLRAQGTSSTPHIDALFGERGRNVINGKLIEWGA